MSADFDPSPRSSKRRKISQYSKQRTILPEDAASSKNSLESTQADGDEQYMSAEEDQLSTPGKVVRTARVPKGSSKLQKVRSGVDASNTIEFSKSSRTASSTGRGRGRKVTASGSPTKNQEQGVEDQEHSVENDDTNGVHAITNGAAPEDTLLDSRDDDQEMAQTRSSGRQRKKPARYTNTESEEVTSSTKRGRAKVVEEPAVRHATESPLKGILTPSKRQQIRPRKSVVFSQDVDTLGEQFGFRDIDTQAKPTPIKEPQKRRGRPADKPVSHVEVPSSLPDMVPEAQDNILDPMLMEDAQPPSPIVPDIPETRASLVNRSLIDGDDQLNLLKATVLSRLTSSSTAVSSRSAPAHLASQYQGLHTLLTATISAGESNSLLLLGPRGSGKSHLLNISLANLTEDFGPDFFHTIRLSGFFQTDDRLALREIWRQLGREMNIDEDETEDVAGSYADTMASLLSLLSHPDEMQVDTNDLTNGSINPEILAQDALGVMTNGEGTMRKTAKSIVFILDEFDLFTTHPRQTLLYNLFDIAQSRKAPIAVIGCSTRMDVIECLEKRVKSRFSHRWLLVPGCTTLAEWEACVKEALTLDVDGKDMLRKTVDEKKLAEEWNEHVTSYFLKTDQVQKLIKSYFYTTKALPDLFMALYPLIATLDLSSTDSTIPLSKSSKDVQLLSQSHAWLSVLSILPTIPALHFSLLISATRLITIHSLPAVNFNLVHAHYVELMARSRLQQTAHGSVAVSGNSREWSRETCREAWEELGHWGTMMPVVGQGVDGGTDGIEGEETRMWRCEVSLEEVEWGIKEKYGNADGSTSAGPGEILAKWCREV